MYAESGERMRKFGFSDQVTIWLFAISPVIPLLVPFALVWLLTSNAWTGSQKLNATGIVLSGWLVVSLSLILVLDAQSWIETPMAVTAGAVAMIPAAIYLFISRPKHDAA